MRPDKTAMLPIAAVAALAIAACGGQGSAATDAGPGDDRPADAGATGCDPAAQNCPTASKCDFGCQGSTAVLSCRADSDGGALGGACSAATPCAKGSGCLTAEDVGVACRKYCAVDGDCPPGERCHDVSVAVACGGASPPLLLHFCY